MKQTWLDWLSVGLSLVVCSQKLFFLQDWDCLFNKQTRDVDLMAFKAVWLEAQLCNRTRNFRKVDHFSEVGNAAVMLGWGREKQTIEVHFTKLKLN